MTGIYTSSKIWKSSDIKTDNPQMMNFHNFNKPNNDF